MPLSLSTVAPAECLTTLSTLIDEIQRDDPLRPVSVIVPTNAAGVTTRRYLGRRAAGVAAVDMLTLDRLAEILAGPSLSVERRPVSTPVLELTIRHSLQHLTGSAGGYFAPVARHASTIRVLREMYEDVRMCGPGATQRLAGGSRAAAAGAEVVDAVSVRLADDWYDRADVLLTAAELLHGDVPSPAAEHVVLLAPEPLRPAEATLLEAIARRSTVQVIFSPTGRTELDDEYSALWRLVDTGPERPAAAPDQPPRFANRIVSVTDPDEEVRYIVRQMLQAARDGVTFDRMVALWPSTEPYARLFEHHLDRADIPWNGRPGTTVAERVVPRFLLDLLELDDRGVRREAVFDLLCDINVRDDDGAVAPTARWERVARAAGVVEADDWTPRLRRYVRSHEHSNPAHAAAASDLLSFVSRLREDLGDPRTTKSWREWAEWARRQISTRLGDDLLVGRAEAERLASDHTLRVLDRLEHLDALGSGPVTRAEFRAVFGAEFDAAPGRLGRIGVGVTVGSVAGYHIADADIVFVVGGAEGVMPPAPRRDPLLTSSDRTAAGLPAAGAAGRRTHRRFLAVLGSGATVTITSPRGDLRGSVERVRSRWLDDADGGVDRSAPPPEEVVVASQHASLLQTTFPVNSAEFRLRGLLATAVAGPIDASTAGLDPVARRALVMRSARRRDRITEFDGDLSTVEVPQLTDPVSPSQLEAWSQCPLAYFQRYLLGVRAVDDPGLEMVITPMQRGNIVHETLDHLHREVIDQALPQPVDGWTDQHRTRAEEIFSDVAARFEVSGRTGRPASWRVERDQLREELRDWFDHDSVRIQTRRTTIVSSEASFGEDGETVLRLADGRGVAVRGTIDRIDQTTDGSLIVIDHKTGRPEPYKALTPDDPTNGGSVFQLPVYAAGARALTKQPGAAVSAYYSLMSRGDFQQYGFTFNGGVDQRVTAALTRIVGGIESGFFPPLPVPPGFQLWVPCPYCDPDGLGTTEVYEQHVVKLADERFEQWLDQRPDEVDREA